MYAFHKIKKQAHIVLVSVSSLFLADLQAGMRVEFFLDIWNIFDAVTASQLRIFHVVKLGSLCQKHLPQVIAWLIDTVLRGWGKRVDYRGCYEGLLYLNWEQAFGCLVFVSWWMQRFDACCMLRKVYDWNI